MVKYRRRAWAPPVLSKPRGCLAVGVLLLISLLAAGCGGGSSSADEGGDTFKIGDVSSFTGGCGLYGQADAAAYDMAAKEINARGGLLGNTPIEIIHEDTESDPDVAVQKVRKLLDQEDVDLIVGVECSNLRDAILPEVEQRNSILLYPSDYEGEKYSDNMFIVGATPSQEERTDMLKTLVDRAGGNKMFLLGADYVGPRSINAYIKEVPAVEAGVEIVGEEYVPQTQTDFSATLKRIQEADPDIIYNNLVGDHSIAFQQQAANMGIRPLAEGDKPGDGKVVMVGHAYFGNSVKSMGATAEGVYRALQWEGGLDTPESREFLEKWEAENPDIEPNYIAEGAYSSILALEAAAERADSVTTEDLLEGFKDLEFTAVSGPAKIRGNDHHTELQMYLFQVKDGEFQVIEEYGMVPPAWDQREARYTK